MANVEVMGFRFRKDEQGYIPRERRKAVFRKVYGRFGRMKDRHGFIPAFVLTVPQKKTALRRYASLCISDAGHAVLVEISEKEKPEAGDYMVTDQKGYTATARIRLSERQLAILGNIDFITGCSLELEEVPGHEESFFAII